MINEEVREGWRIWIQEQIERMGYVCQVEIHRDIIRIYTDKCIKLTPTKYRILKQMFVELLCNYIKNTEDGEVAEKLCRVVKNKAGWDKYMHIDNDLIEFDMTNALAKINKGV